MEKLYVIGKTVAGGYPSGRYACTRVEGRVHDHYIVKLVIDYPSVRAVANCDAWSNAKVYPYCKMLSVLRSSADRMPEEYDGEVEGLEEADYTESVRRALKKAIVEYEYKGDGEAVERLVKLYTA